MSEVVWKYTLDLLAEKSIFDMPADAVILHAREQQNDVCIWARVDPRNPRTKRRFKVVGTGNSGEIEPTDFYLGTAMLYGGHLVLHLFEIMVGATPEPSTKGE